MRQSIKSRACFYTEKCCQYLFNRKAGQDGEMPHRITGHLRDPQGASVGHSPEAARVTVFRVMRANHQIISTPASPAELTRARGWGGSQEAAGPKNSNSMAPKSF